MKPLNQTSIVNAFTPHREDGSPGIGEFLANFAELVGDNPNDDWAANIIQVADPTIGNDGLGGCGVIGSQCAPQIDCEDWASRGYGGHYWAIQALIGYVRPSSNSER